MMMMMMSGFVERVISNPQTRYDLHIDKMK